MIQIQSRSKGRKKKKKGTVSTFSNQSLGSNSLGKFFFEKWSHFLTLVISCKTYNQVKLIDLMRNCFLYPASKTKVDDLLASTSLNRWRKAVNIGIKRKKRQLRAEVKENLLSIFKQQLKEKVFRLLELQFTIFRCLCFRTTVVCNDVVMDGWKRN